jgi:hypothetical protein
MAVNRPTGDKAHKGAVKKPTQLKNPLTKTSTKRKQGGRSVHGRQKVREEVQRSADGEVISKIASVVAVCVAFLFGFAAWDIML